MWIQWINPLLNLIVLGILIYTAWLNLRFRTSILNEYNEMKNQNIAMRMRMHQLEIVFHRLHEQERPEQH